MRTNEPALNVTDVASRDAGGGHEAARSLSRRAMLGGSVTALAGLSGCADVVVGKRDENEWSFDLSNGALRVDAEQGSVRVRPQDRDAVDVRIEKRGSLFTSIEAVEVSAGRDGDAVVVESRVTDDGANLPNVNVAIDVPEGVTIESLAGANGDVSVHDVPIAGGTAVRTTNGGIDVRGTTDPLPVPGSDDGVHARTQNGGVRLENVEGYVSGETTNGGVDVRRCTGIGDATTSNGGIEADVTAVRDDVSLTTTNGGIDAALSPDLDVRVVAETTNGGIDVGGPVTTETNTQTYVEGTVGDGTHELRLVTTNGGIDISQFEGTLPGR